MAQAVNGSPVAVSSPNDISPVETHSPPGSYLWPGARHTGSRRPTDTAGRACTRPRSTDTARRARHPVGYQGRSSFPEVVELPRIGTGIFAKYPAAVDSNPKLRSRSASIINIDQHTCIIVVATCLVQAYDLIGPTTDLQSSSASSSTTRQEHASSTKATWSRSPPPQRHASASSSRPASSRPTPSSASIWTIAAPRLRAAACHRCRAASPRGHRRSASSSSCRRTPGWSAIPWRWSRLRSLRQRLRLLILILRLCAV